VRFEKAGPDIPDDLLRARDEGRVVFFCGAGVSRARANLPDFFGLAQVVLDHLRAPTDHRARRLLAEAETFEERTGVGGVISADRIFALLERDFTISDVEAAVAKALRPPPRADRSAHKLLADLARTQEGQLRLVTTNFDRLFERYRKGAPIWTGPHLPDPNRAGEMHGLVYLHGRVNSSYTASQDDGFVLSSPQFGQAYLADGWATEFIRSVIEKYVVVFIGYSADDPPIQYLLEALTITERHGHSVYAFQQGNSAEATGRWSHKGVEAIPYDGEQNHQSLWETLSAWAQRAGNPADWSKSIVNLAQFGPQPLEPHQRGQVAHLVSTPDGARLFAQADPIPPAEWLCTFDPRQRYANPVRDWFDEEAPPADPFPLFSLDSDLPPEKAELERSSREREVPAGAWDALRPTRLDLTDLAEPNFASAYGPGSLAVAVLPPRLTHLGQWISKVADQPSALWWAVRKGGLHPAIQRMVKWQLERQAKGATLTNVLLRGWNYLFAFWTDSRIEHGRDWYELTGRIKREGWDAVTLRLYGDHFRPSITVSPALRSPVPPANDEKARMGDLIHLDVAYADVPE